MTKLRIVLFVLIWTHAGSGVAADIRIVDSNSGYNMQVSGVIRDGDLETLQGIFKGKKGFPQVTQVSLVAGSAQAAMRLGWIYREAGLSLVATDPCGSSCFLWLLGGASRTAVDNLSPRLWELGSQQNVVEYMLAMDVPADQVDRLLATKAPGSEATIYADEFATEIGEVPAGFENWLLDKCGAPIDQEQEDERLVQAASFLVVLKRMQKEDPARLDLAPIIAKYERYSAQADELNPAYKQQLVKAASDIRRCRKSLVSARQEKLIDSF